jgi:hypothetical protein
MAALVMRARAWRARVFVISIIQSNSGKPIETRGPGLAVQPAFALDFGALDGHSSVET